MPISDPHAMKSPPIARMPHSGLQAKWHATLSLARLLPKAIYTPRLLFFVLSVFLYVSSFYCLATFLLFLLFLLSWYLYVSFFHDPFIILSWSFSFLQSFFLSVVLSLAMFYVLLSFFLALFFCLLTSSTRKASIMVFSLLMSSVQSYECYV